MQIIKHGTPKSEKVYTEVCKSLWVGLLLLIYMNSIQINKMEISALSDVRVTAWNYLSLYL